MNTDEMNTEQFLAYTKTVSDPREALKCIVDNEDYLGYDPYYRDLRSAMVDMAKRVATEEKT